MNAGKKEIGIVRVRRENAQHTQDVVAVEEPLEIQVQEFGKAIPRSISVTMRTPGQDPALATGFLYTEGLISEPADILSVSITAENQVCVRLREGLALDVSSSERNFYTTSSCGVCGKSSIEAIHTHRRFDLTTCSFQVKEKLLFSLTDQLQQQQSLFAATGGIHAATLFSANAQLKSMQEDVGRHNALDKLIGDAVQNDDLPLSESILLLSGRASFELIQKSAMAGIPIVVAIGAPSSLAIELAKETGQTLIGFLKSTGYNLYSGHERIIR